MRETDDETSDALEDSLTANPSEPIETDIIEKVKHRRTAKACDMCVKKRRKCSGNMPCDSCVSRNINCTFDNPTRRRGPVLNEPVKETEKNTKLSGAEIFIPFLYDAQLSNLPLNAFNEDQQWSVGSFSWIEVNENGRLFTKEWTAVYFSNIHHQFPVLSPDLFYANKHQIPQFLLHAMYAVSIAGASQSASGDFHFTHCKLLFQGNLDTPTAMTVFSTLLMSYYSLMYQKSKGGGPSLAAAAIRSFQNLLKSRIGGGIPTYKPLDSIDTLSKELMQLLVYVLFEMDYKTGVKFKIPFIFYDPPINYEMVISKEPYNLFYKSKFWIYHLKLLEIAKSIEIRRLNVDQHKIDLQKWFSALPLYMQDSESFSESILSSSKPSWKVAYLKIFYHYLVIQIYKPEFKKHIVDNQDHASVKKAIESAVIIGKLVQEFNKNNPNFHGVSLFIYQYIYNSAMVLIISKTVDAGSFGYYFDSNLLAIQYFGKILYQNRHLPGQLVRLKDSPELALLEF
ncbi:hypothetical protein HDV06_004522 [Boothiomyces sp. JEL0866]|nr:hypothetical protein HDV06_004522 [Boothiomyces sp. JEL0866]